MMAGNQAIFLEALLCKGKRRHGTVGAGLQGDFFRFHEA